MHWKWNKTRQKSHICKREPNLANSCKGPSLQSRAQQSQFPYVGHLYPDALGPRRAAKHVKTPLLYVVRKVGHADGSKRVPSWGIKRQQIMRKRYPWRPQRKEPWKTAAAHKVPPTLYRRAPKALHSAAPNNPGGWLKRCYWGLRILRVATIRTKHPLSSLRTNAPWVSLLH